MSRNELIYVGTLGTALMSRAVTGNKRKQFRPRHIQCA